MRKLGRFDDFVHGFALAGRTGGVGQHGDAGFDAEDTGGMRRADGDVRKLAGCGIRIDRAVAEHKDAILEAHEEHARNDGGIRLRLDDFKGGTDGVGRGVHSAGNHAVGVADLNHHRAEVGRVLHTLLRLLQRKALALAHFVILLGIGIETRGGCGLDNRGILQLEAKLLDLFLDGVGIAKQDDIRNPTLAQGLGGAQNPQFLPFGQDDAHTMFLSLLREVELEHHRGNAIRAEVENLVDEGFLVHAFGESVKRHGDLPIVFGGNLSVQLQQFLTRIIGGALHGKDGDRDARPAFHELLHTLGQIDAAGEEDARNVGIGGRKVRGQAGEDDVGTVPGGDDQQILLKVVHEIADLHSRDKVVVNKVVQAFLAEKHVGVHPFLDFTDARPNFPIAVECFLPKICSMDL